MYALPKEKLFPVDTDRHVRMSLHYFEKQAQKMTPSQRVVCARGICKAASDRGISFESNLVYKYAQAQISPYFEDFMDMRKEATAGLCKEEIEDFKNMVKTSAKSVADLDAAMVAVERFDRDHGLDGLWESKKLPDPAFTMYSPTPDADTEITIGEKIAGRTFTREMLKSADMTKLTGLIGDDAIQQLQSPDDGYSFYQGLPREQREVIAQALED